MFRALLSSLLGAVGAAMRAIDHFWRWPRTPAMGWVAALAVALPMSCLGANTVDVEVAEACVWHADSNAVYRVGSDGNVVLTSVKVKNTLAAAMNSRDCGVAVLAEKQFLRYAQDGEQLASAPFAAISAKLNSPHDLIADPYDASLWIAENRIVFQVGSSGQLLSTWSAPGTIRSIAISLDRTFWILGNEQLWHLAPNGEVLGDYKLNKLTQAIPNRIAFDSLAGKLWLVGDKHVTLLDAQKLDSPQQQLALPKPALGSALNPVTGDFWIATATHLYAYNRNGSVTIEVALAEHGLGVPAALAFDPVTQSLWVANDDALARYASSGEFLGRTAGNGRSRALASPTFSMAPLIKLTRPQGASVSNNSSPSISYSYDILCNGRPCLPSMGAEQIGVLSASLNQQFLGPFAIDNVARQASFTVAAPLSDGDHFLAAQARTRFGHASNVVHDQFSIDTVAPRFIGVVPASGSAFALPAATIQGEIDDAGAAVVLDGVAAIPLTHGAGGTARFSLPVTLAPGDNVFALSAVDKAGNIASHKLVLRFDPPLPPPPVAAKLATGALNAGSVTVSGSGGAVPAGTRVILTNTRTGQQMSATADSTGAFAVTMPAAAGDAILVRSVSQWGGLSEAVRLLIPSVQGYPVDPDSTPGVIPPDPATLAPKINPTVPTRIEDSTAFLYSGPDAIQTGVAAGTIQPRRVAVLRGKVIAQDGTPLAAVRVRVHGHPEYGQTHSRADGRFDIAVNGGGLLTLAYDKTGVLPAQRQVLTPWKDFVTVPDVALVAFDGKVTQVDLAASQAIQVAQGSMMSDANGERQATLLFQPGTTATMRLKDGTTVPLTTANVRATEYTVGANGPAAMPGQLPPNSGYTYAVEFSVDEAVSAGARDVSFSQPVHVYVDNFMKFPVGEVVPSGYYDRDKTAWVASANGRIIKLLSVANGVANVDIAGNGAAADAAALLALGVTTDELIELARRFTPGKSFWRVPVTHFTPYDFNWPFGPPADSVPASGCDTSGKCLDNAPDEDEPSEECGSVIQVENQVLGESIPVAGTPFSLHYTSSKNERKLRIPLSATSVPQSLRRIDLILGFAGQEVRRSFGPAAGQVFEHDWDGLDGYGRAVVGKVAVSVKISYIYAPVFYRSTQERDKAFAQASIGLQMPVDQERGEFSADRQFTLYREGAVPSAGMGGWSLDAHYSYDPAGGGRLRSGDGTTQSALTLNATSAAANMDYTVGMALDDAGNIYTANYTGVHKIGTDGIITKVMPWYNQRNLARDSLGNFYYTHEAMSTSTLYKRAPDGTATPLVGDGWAIPESQHQDVRPAFLAVAADGTIYFAQNTGLTRQGSFVQRCYVKKLGTDGVVSIVAGTGSCSGATGDNGPATRATLRRMTGVAIDSRGNLYVSDWYAVRKISPDGVIRTVAGAYDDAGIPCYDRGPPPDGIAAVETCLGNIASIAIDREDKLIITSWDIHGAGNTLRSLIRRLHSDGTLATVAMTNSACSAATKNPLSAVTRAQGICSDQTFGATAVNANNEIVSALGGNIMTVGPTEMRCSGANGQFAMDCNGTLTAKGDKVYPSADGQRLFVFDQAGRHVRTLSAKTGSLIYEFRYDDSGRLLGVTDANSNLTTIERGQDDQLTGVVGPYGHRTHIGLDANGRIASLTNPNNETYKMVTSASALLERFEKPRQFASVFEYDELGRMVTDRNAAGGGLHLDRSETGDGAEVKVTSALGRFQRYLIERTASGAKFRATIAQDGNRKTELIGADGTTVETSAGGTVTTTVMGPDPRFGMQSPMAKSVSITLPSGLKLDRTASRTVTLNSPSDPLSLLKETNITLVNGKQFKTELDTLNGLYAFTSAMNRQRILAVDGQGRPLQARWPDSHPVNYAYDVRGRLELVSQGMGDDVRALQYVYDEEGNVRSVQDTLTGKTSYAYDKAGRVTAVTLPNDRIVRVGYDANGNVISVTPPGRPAHGRAYSSVDQVIGNTAPPSGTQPATTRYDYNLDKQMTKVSRPDGQFIEYGYDSFGRLASSATEGRVVRYAYDPATGLLASVSAPDGINAAYSYDGEFVTGVTVGGPAPGSLSFGYDTFFRIGRVGVNGSEIAFGYDDDDLLTSAGALQLVRAPTSGKVTGTQLGQLATTMTYDQFGKLAGTTVKFGATVLYSEQHVTGTGGRLAGKTVVKRGAANTYGYGYDTVGRLKDVTRDGAPVAHFEYDANGNRTQAYGVTAEYDEQDRLKRYGDADYTYTASGDLKEIAVGSEVKVFDYFATGSLRHVKLPGGTTIDYLVDGEGRRVGKKVNGVLTQGLLYQDELKPAAELDGQGNVVSRFVYAGRPNVPDYMVKGGITYRIVSDHLGSVQMVVNSATGEIAQQIDYDEWGNILLDTNPGFQPFGYAGGMYDRDTGLVRFGARDYDPVTGRWTAMDPLGFAGGDSNLYAYVGGNPLSYTDPLGLWRLPDYGAIGVPIIGPVGVSITVDRHGNVYGGIGIGASIRGGAGLGVGWTGDKCTPNSKQTQNFLGGWGYNAGVGIGVTSSGSGVPGSGPSESFGWNVQTPGVGVGYNWNLGNLGNFFK